MICLFRTKIPVMLHIRDCLAALRRNDSEYLNNGPKYFQKIIDHSGIDPIRLYNLITYPDKYDFTQEELKILIEMIREFPVKFVAEVRFL